MHVCPDCRIDISGHVTYCTRTTGLGRDVWTILISSVNLFGESTKPRVRGALKLRFHSHLYAALLAIALPTAQAAGQDTGPARVFGSLNALADDSLGQPLLDSLLRPDGGISLEPVYYGELFSNTRGGISTSGATRYEALLDLPFTIDFEQMQSPLPGRFFLLAQNTHGQGLTEDFVGDTQVVSNIDSFNNIMQVSEYWWEFGLFDDQLVVRLGKQDLNTEFLVIDLAEDFIQSSFGLSPNVKFSVLSEPQHGRGRARPTHAIAGTETRRLGCAGRGRRLGFLRQ